MNLWTLVFAISMILTLVFTIVTGVLLAMKRSAWIKSLYCTLAFAILFILTLAEDNSPFLVALLLSCFIGLVLLIAGIVLSYQKHRKAKNAWVGVGITVVTAVLSILLSITLEPESSPATTEVAATNETATKKEEEATKKEAEKAAAAKLAAQKAEEQKIEDKRKKEEEQKEEEERKAEENKRKEQLAKAEAEKKKAAEEAKKKEEEKAKREAEIKAKKEEKKKAEEKAKREAEEKIKREEVAKKKEEETKKEELAKQEAAKKAEETKQKEQSEKISRKDGSLGLDYVTFNVMWSLVVDQLGSSYIYEYKNEMWMDNHKLFTADFTNDLSLQYQINKEKHITSIILTSAIPENESEVTFKELYDTCYGLVLTTNPDATEKQQGKILKKLFAPKGKLVNLKKVDNSYEVNGVTYVLKTSSSSPDTLHFGVISSKALK
ncbi:protein TolA [Priestia megaterium]|nr:protein TolA [Priestia megaterium]